MNKSTKVNNKLLIMLLVILALIAGCSPSIEESVNSNGKVYIQDNIEYEIVGSVHSSKTIIWYNTYINKFGP